MRKTTPMPDIIRDWHDLPPELIHLISRKLGDLAFYIRFRAVCNKWRSAAPLSDPPQQLPWLRKVDNNEKNVLTFYSITSGMTYKIPFPSHRYRLCTNVSYTQQYLLADCVCTDNIYQCCLFNPITHKSIPLISPPGRTIQDRPTIIQKEEDMVSFVRQPSVYSRTLGFYELRDREWKTVTIGDKNKGAYACYKGMVFVNVDDTGATRVLDPTTDTVAYVIPAPVVAPHDGRPERQGFSYFIESSGELLGVRWSWGICKTDSYSFGLDVYRLDYKKNKQSRWIKMSDIGDRILFLFKHSGLSFRSSEVGGHKGNCIYYKMSHKSLKRYDIKEQTTVSYEFPRFRYTGWFVPST